MEAFEIETELAAVAVFDGQVLEHRIRDKNDWWRQCPLAELDEIRDGRAAILSIGKHGTYRLAFREGEPNEAERALISGEVAGLGLVVESGQVFVGIGERLPGDGRGGRLSAIPGTGLVVELEPGAYNVTVSVLDWRHLDEHYDDDNEILPTAPPDFLVTVGPRAALTFPEPLPPLLELKHKREAKGSTSVPSGMRKRRASPSPAPRRRRGSSEPSAPRPYVIERRRAEVPEEVAPYSYERVRDAFDAVIDPALRAPSPIDAREIELVPRDRSLSAKGIAFADVLKKATTVREQMRVLEAKVNSSDKLDLSERLELQLCVTRVYQSLEALLEHLG
jgi:hypothetical protein